MEEDTVTVDEYRRICDWIARNAIAHAVQMTAADPDSGNITDEHAHWIDVYLDERLPDIDADALLDITTSAGAFEKSASQPTASREITGRHALQADVWDAINRMEKA